MHDHNRSKSQDITLLDMQNFNNLYNLYNYYDINNLLIKNIEKEKQILFFFLENKNKNNFNKKLNIKTFHLLKNTILKVTGLSHERFQSVESVAITADNVGKSKKELANLIKTESLDYLRYIKEPNWAMSEKDLEKYLNVLNEMDLDQYNNYINTYIYIIDNNVYKWLFYDIFNLKYNYLNYKKVNFLKYYINLFNKNELKYIDNEDTQFLTFIYDFYFYFVDLYNKLIDMDILKKKAMKFDFIKAFHDFNDFKLFYFEKKMLERNNVIINLYDNTNTRFLQKLELI
jgi:hypothetical protein